jgi:predicted RNA-binding Zn-ribbon protein involved in translation (DUF1610 family)
METERHIPMSHYSCPKCGSSDIRRARSEGALSAFLRIFGRWPFRCRSCRRRFYLASVAPDDDLS